MKTVFLLIIFLVLVSPLSAEEWYEAEESSSTEYARSVSTSVAADKDAPEHTPRYSEEELKAIIVEKDMKAQHSPTLIAEVAEPSVGIRDGIPTGAMEDDTVERVDDGVGAIPAISASSPPPTGPPPEDEKK